MKVLVTGGAGFVGTNLIKKLVENNHSVISVDNYHTGKKENHIEGATYLDYDLRKINYYEIFGFFDVVYHLAAIARIQPSFEIPYDYFTTNANVTFKLANYCSKYNTPLIYAGSSSHHSGKFKNPYTFSKDVGEDVIKLFQTHYNLNGSIARFYNVYGPYHLKEGGYKTLIGTWENAIENNQPLKIFGDGNKRRDFTHIDDIVDGLLKIKEKESWGNIFEFGRGVNYSINEIADMFEHERVYMDEKPGEAQVTLCDYTLAKELLDWEPKKNIQEYIRNYLGK